jgi:hypothetical protein
MDLKYHIADSYSTNVLVDEFIRTNISSIFEDSFEKYCPVISVTDFMNMHNMMNMCDYSKKTFDEFWLSSPRKFAYELDGTRFIYVFKAFKSGPLLETDRKCLYMDSHNIWNVLVNRCGRYTYLYDGQERLKGLFDSEEEALDDAFNRVKHINGEILKALTEMKENLDEIIRDELIQMTKGAKRYLRNKCEFECLDEQIDSLKQINEARRPQI